MLKIRNKDEKYDYIRKIKNVCDKNGVPVFIYGAGVYARKIEEFLHINGLDNEIINVVDDKYLTDFEDESKVISFTKYLEKYSLIAPLVFGIYNYTVVKKVKEKYTGIIKNMFDFHLTVVNDFIVDWNLEYFKENYEQFAECYNMFSDERSRHVMQSYIDAATAGEFDHLFNNYYDSIQYFNEIFNGVEINKLFDCGAYDGDSVHDFIIKYPNYQKIFAFEPDKLNVQKIWNRIKEEKIHDLEIVEKGVWSETTTLYFLSEGKSSSYISNEGSISIDVIRLDDMYDEFTSESLIKMDIEGSELEALKGASKVISEISPALAICVYHKREDLITIPKYIDSLVKPGTYEYHLGYQGLDLAELVFYALPKKESVL